VGTKLKVTFNILGTGKITVDGEIAGPVTSAGGLVNITTAGPYQGQKSVNVSQITYIAGSGWAPRATIVTEFTALVNPPAARALLQTLALTDIAAGKSTADVRIDLAQKVVDLTSTITGIFRTEQLYLLRAVVDSVMADPTVMVAQVNKLDATTLANVPIPAKLIHVRSFQSIFLLLPWAVLAALPAQGQTSPALTPPQAQALVDRALAAELRSVQDKSHPMRFRLHKSSPRLTSTKEIVETKDGAVARLVSRFDKPLNQEEEQAEQAFATIAQALAEAGGVSGDWDTTTTSVSGRKTCRW